MVDCSCDTLCECYITDSFDATRQVWVPMKDHCAFRADRLFVSIIAAVSVLAPGSTAAAQDPPRFVIEIEGGPVWQSRNDLQIPNDASGTRFSLVDLAGTGPQPAGRLYLTWNISERHGLRALLAPLSFTEAGTPDEAIDFAGESYQAGTSLEGTYKFNSWRLGYRYLLNDAERLKLFIGFTAKIRDAKVELQQGGTSSRKTDVGFVPLLHLAADWRYTDSWRVLFDFDGLAGGPGRAFDVALKLGYDITDRWGIAAGYRTIEGGADVEPVYSFAWLHYAVASMTWRF